MDVVLASKVVYDIVLLGSCGYIILAGGADERVGAAIAIVASGASALVGPISQILEVKWRYGLTIVDLATLLCFDALMVRSTAFWPVWVTGFQLAAVCINIMMIVDPVAGRPYLTLQQFWALPILLSMSLGARRARRSSANSG